MARILTDEERAQHERVTGRFGDARAQLWARVYATMFEQGVRGCIREIGTAGAVTTTEARKAACEGADAAVRDFDEHYLGGK